MLKQIQNLDIEKFIFDGMMIPGENYIIQLNIGEEVSINLKNVIQETSKITSEINLTDLKFICKNLKLEATLFPSGNILFQKNSPAKFILKNCYLIKCISGLINYIICIALDEIQPGLYKAQLVGAFIIE